MKILETKNLIKRFEGVRALDGLSLGIEKGQIVGIVGPNGSGKTTLINVLTGILASDGGVVIFRGTSLEKIKPFHISFYGITRTFQTIRLFEQMTVLDNILVVCTERSAFSALFERHEEYHWRRAREVLESVGLWEKRNELAVNLSYGQRKLLEIARALATRAEIFLFDEPFAGLFPAMRKIIVLIFKKLREEGKTILFIEHDMGLIRELADYVYVMDSGQLLAEGNPEEALGRKEVLDAYLGD